MTDKNYLSWKDVECAVNDIAVQLYKNDWRPDYIVGIHSGGSIPAVMLGKMLGIKTYSLDVRLRDGEGECESNLWMSEEAIGYGGMGCLEDEKAKILIVDDINDSGATYKWIKEDWKSSCLPSLEEWNTVFGDTVRFAVLVNNLGSSEMADYYSMEINKAEKDSWIVFPWEEWYRHET